MSLQEQVFHAHAVLKRIGLRDITRSQVYELMSAAVHYPTYAAFQHDCVWCDIPLEADRSLPDRDGVARRAVELGLSLAAGSLAAEALCGFLEHFPYCPVRLETLIATAEGERGEEGYEQWVYECVIERLAEDGFEGVFRLLPVLLDSLDAAADRGVALAHLAIARLLEPEAEVSEEDDARFARHLMRTGRWEAERIGFDELKSCGSSFPLVLGKYRYHLLAAAKAGDAQALWETAERYSNPALLDDPEAGVADPMELARQARKHGRTGTARHFLKAAATALDVDAMRELIAEPDTPLEEAWMWMHLSRLVGHDLSRDRHVAINEDGSLYDFDVGGPAYGGGEDGIVLKPLGAEQDFVARTSAQAIYDAVATPSPDV
ncbi:MAG: hypothetical protein ACOY37_01875 [Pseudomonadota bacterium]